MQVWSLALKTLVEFDMRTQSTGLDRTHIRTVCWLTRTILVGTHDSGMLTYAERMLTYADVC